MTESSMAKSGLNEMHNKDDRLKRRMNLKVRNLPKQNLSQLIKYKVRQKKTLRKLGNL